MSKQLALTGGRTSVPSPASPEFRNVVAVLSNGIEQTWSGTQVAAESAPTREQRGMLQARLELLDGYLGPVGRSGAMAQMAILSTHLTPRRRGSDKDADNATELYLRNIADLPAFALVEAVGDYVRAKEGDGKWMPDSPALRKLAQAKAAPFVEERARILRVLQAKVQPPRPTSEQRAKTVAGLRGFAQELRDKAAERGEGEAYQATSESSAMDRHGAPMPKLSEACSRVTRRGLGRDVRAEDEDTRLQAEFDRHHGSAA